MKSFFSPLVASSSDKKEVIASTGAKGMPRPVIVPAHSGNLSLRVIKSNLRTLGITDDEFSSIIDSL